MNLALKILGGLLGGGAVATGTWVIYDTANPILAKKYKDAWKPIPATFTKPLEGSSSDSYTGSSYFQRFFGIEIQKFNITTSGSANSNSIKFDTLFENTSDIYGCAVGNEKFYELVLKNDKVGFATWFDGSNQKTFKLTKSNGNWKIELGIWTNVTTDESPTKNFTDIEPIKSKIQNETENWYWWFYMPKSEDSTNMQSWFNVFQPGTDPTAIYEDNKWKSTNITFSDPSAKIPNFEKVKDLGNFCKKQGSIRNNIIKTEDEEKLNLYCLAPQSSNK